VQGRPPRVPGGEVHRGEGRGEEHGFPHPGGRLLGEEGEEVAHQGVRVPKAIQAEGGEGKASLPSEASLA